MFLFLVLGLTLAFVLRQVKTKYHSGITQAQRYLPHVVVFGQWKQWIQIYITSRLNSLYGFDDFACALASHADFLRLTSLRPSVWEATCACIYVEFRFHLGHRYCLGLCLSLCSRR